MASAVLRDHVPRTHWRRELPYWHDAYGREWRDAWQRPARRAARTGHVTELHAARDDYQAVFKAHLQILDALGVLNGQYGWDGPPPEHLHHARRELQQLHDEIF